MLLQGRRTPSAPLYTSNALACNACLPLMSNPGERRLSTYSSSEENMRSQNDASAQEIALGVRIGAGGTTMSINPVATL
jgi:hypothetical protein